MEDNEILKQGLAAIVSRLESTEAFVIEHAPEICKQMLYERIVDKLFGAANQLVGFLISDVAILLCLHSFYNAGLDRDGDWGALKVVSFIGSLGFSFASIVFLAGFSFDLKERFLIKKCPKLYLLREFKRLLK